MDTAVEIAPTSALLERIRAGIIGDGEVLDGPYGPRRIAYAHYTASGRALDFVKGFTATRCCRCGQQAGRHPRTGQ
jgi:hypothetical protein